MPSKRVYCAEQRKPESEREWCDPKCELKIGPGTCHRLSTSKRVEALKSAQFSLASTMGELNDAAEMGVPVDSILDLCREVRKRVEASTRAQEQIEAAR